MSDDNELDNAKNILIDGIGALLGGFIFVISRSGW